MAGRPTHCGRRRKGVPNEGTHPAPGDSGRAADRGGRLGRRARRVLRVLNSSGPPGRRARLRGGAGQPLGVDGGRACAASRSPVSRPPRSRWWPAWPRRCSTWRWTCGPGCRRSGPGTPSGSARIGGPRWSCRLASGTPSFPLPTARPSSTCSPIQTTRVERRVNPLDPDIGIAWPPEVTPVMSPRDASAPGPRESLEAGLLPGYSACLSAGQHKAR